MSPLVAATDDTKIALLVISLEKLHLLNPRRSSAFAIRLTAIELCQDAALVSDIVEGVIDPNKETSPYRGPLEWAIA